MADGALVGLLAALEARGYRFVTPTPSTCRRIVEQPPPEALSLRDIFGWSLPFREDQLDPALLTLLRRAGELDEAGDGRLKSRLRASSVHGRLFLHSAFPTNADDAVFLGPDTYRFADFIRSETSSGGEVGVLVDVGAGAGVGGILGARFARPRRVILTDVNPSALRLAEANAVHAGVEVELRFGEGLQTVAEGLDLVVANPPYIAGDSGPTYREGGDLHGGRISLDWAVAAMDRLNGGGRMLLYTGSAILRGGRDLLAERLGEAAAAAGCGLDYRELDPDVFGEELRRPAYRDVERLAAVGAVITRRSAR